MSPLPNVAGALYGMTSAIRLKVATISVEDHEATQSFGDDVVFQGVIVPQTPQQLQAKPEGQRDWKWWALYTTRDMKPNDMIVDASGDRYKVVQKAPWAVAGAGFNVYDLQQGWQ